MFSSYSISLLALNLFAAVAIPKSEERGREAKVPALVDALILILHNLHVCSPLYTVYTAGYDLFRQDCTDHGIVIKDPTPASSKAQATVPTSQSSREAQ